MLRMLTPGYICVAPFGALRSTTRNIGKRGRKGEGWREKGRAASIVCCLPLFLSYYAGSGVMRLGSGESRGDVGEDLAKGGRDAARVGIDGLGILAGLLVVFVVGSADGGDFLLPALDIDLEDFL